MERQSLFIFSPEGTTGILVEQIPVAPSGLLSDVGYSIHGLTPMATTCRPVGTEFSRENNIRIMLTPSQNEIASRKIFSGQLIAGAMICGALFFGGMIATTANWSDLNGPFSVMATIAAASAIVLFGVAFVAPTLFAQLPNFKKSNDPATQDKGVGEISSMLVSQNTARLALLLAAIFANIMPLMFDPRWANVVAIAIGLLLMLINFPFRSRSLRKIESRLDEWG